jgi:exonuclease III
MVSNKGTQKFTWNARGQRPIIDHTIVNQELPEIILDCRISRGFEIKSDHSMLVARAKIQRKWHKK